MDVRLTKLANVLVNYSVEVRPGDFVLLQGPFAAEPLAIACAQAILEAGGRLFTQFESPGIRELVYRMGNDDQIAFLPDTFHTLIRQIDRAIQFLAPVNTQSMRSIPSDRIAIREREMAPLLRTWLERTASGEFKWTGTAFPTNAAAQECGMSLSEYEDFVFGAGLLEANDPVAEWKALSNRQQRIVEWLTGKSQIHLEAPGTDLRLSVAGRKWLNDDGHLNFPGGEVYTGPVEGSIEGSVAFTFPGFYRGHEVPGIRLRFESGRVVEASAERDEQFLNEMLALDDGAKSVGEVAFGLNAGIQQFTKQTLFDEKIGGTMHLALGASYPETGGTNQSALHWDIVLDLRQGGTVTVDDQLFSKDGAIVI